MSEKPIRGPKIGEFVSLLEYGLKKSTTPPKLPEW